MKDYIRAKFVPDLLQPNQIYVGPEKEGHQIPKHLCAQLVLFLIKIERGKNNHVL